MAGLEVTGESGLWADSASRPPQLIVATDEDTEPIRVSFDDTGLPALLLLSDDPEAVTRAARSGAGGWAVVPVNATAEDLASAAAAAVRGFVVTPASWTRDRPAGDELEEDDLAPRERLTAREREVLELVAEGRSNRAIAAALGISEHTVKFHLASIYGKLGASTRTQAVRRGLRRGLITI